MGFSVDCDQIDGESGKGMWIVYPRCEVKEQNVLQAGSSAGLTDLKVVRFSRTETALLFVPRKKK
ncbi:MAG: hypothetical protein ACYCW6_24240 [Candidatus Xenobia bacterium]